MASRRWVGVSASRRRVGGGGFFPVGGRTRGMANWTSDSYTRKTVVITLLWLVAMLLGGLLLLQFGGALESALT